jgi:GT2 family glycosyltransferase
MQAADVTAVISTKDRYFSTLPHTLIAICKQTCKPKRVIVFDDGECKDLRNDNLYSHIFSLLSFYGMDWSVEPGGHVGQVTNHIKSLEMAKTEWIWRLDDDNVPEPDVLEKLMKNVGDKVGAIGGLVVQSNAIKPLPSIASNRIEDIYLGQNEQWFIYPENAKPKEVDHLYSSFLYRRSIASYCTELSPVGHREETMMTYEMKLKGFVNILDPSARTWHLCNPTGGIRSYEDRNNWSHDERIFARKLSEWQIKINDFCFTILDNGLGDHFAFRTCLPAYFEKHKDKRHIFFVCFPEVFEDCQNVKLASIADAKLTIGNLDSQNLYKWMVDNKWTQSLPDAFAGMHKLPAVVRDAPVKQGTGSTIIISPYSFHPKHAKSYPYWTDLVPKIKSLGYTVVQVGRQGEEPLQGLDDYWWGLPLKELQKRVTDCRCWISVDNFLQHMCNSMDTIVPGVVIWGESNPSLFGYSYNRNVLKSQKFLRPNQFDIWHGVKQKEYMFDSADKVFENITKFLQV